ncbi:MAG: MEDS domain-containing protein [Haloarculaceae archaeon]
MTDAPAETTVTADSGHDGEYDRLRSQFAEENLSRHIALFYRDRAEQLAVVSAFVARGLRRGERVLYIFDDNDEETIAEGFENAGIDVERARETGQLAIIDASDIYVGETFEPDETVDRLEGRAAEAITDGFEGLRLAGENTWSFDCDCEFERIIEFEVKFDERCPEIPVTAMCQYSLDQFDDAAIGKALQTHEQIVYRGDLCRNPYYVPPEEALATGQPMSNATLLLEQTRDNDQFRRDIETREQRLSVVNRVLRHNLRNEINVIRGRVEWLQQHDAIARDDEIGDQIGTIDETARRLSELAEKARHVDRTLESTSRERATLGEIVTEAVEDTERAHPDAEFDVTTDSQGETVVDSTVRVAIEEILDIAAAQSSDPTVSVSLEIDDRGRAIVDVITDGAFVPERTRTALEERREKALQHATGLGLWVAQWVVEKTNGSLDVDSPERDRVRITVPTVAGDDGR